MISLDLGGKFDTEEDTEAGAKEDSPRVAELFKKPEPASAQMTPKLVQASVISLNLEVKTRKKRVSVIELQRPRV